MTSNRWPLWLKLFGWLTAAGFVVGVAGLIFVSIVLVRWSADLDDIDETVILNYEPPVMTRVHAGDGALIAEYSQESRVFVPIENIPENVVHAFIAAEDKNFYTHSGVDFVGVGKAQIRNVLNCLRGSCTKQGGSSITQQVAKNFFLSPEQTLKRKALEFMLARKIERFRTKDDILELYFNEIYLGRRSYGVAAAALLYFGKPLDELTLGETAYLAALPKAPSTLDITNESRRPRALDRRNYVLGRMVVNGYITEEEAALARQEPLEPVDRLTDSRFRAAGFFVEQVRREVFDIFGEDELYRGGLSIRTTLDTTYQRYARNALRFGLESYDRRHGYRGPLGQIESFDNWKQTLAEMEMPGAVDNWKLAVVLEMNANGAIVGVSDGDVGQIPLWRDGDPNTDDVERNEDVIPLEDTPLNWARKFIAPNANEAFAPSTVGPAITNATQVLSVGDLILVEALNAEERIFALRQVPEINGAIMAMDPHTGRVLAMVGGYYFEFGTSELNRTIQARRQPGSSFKPFVYAAAFEAGMTPADTENAGPYAEPVANSDTDWYLPKEYLPGLGSFRGNMTLRQGVEKSKNTLTIRVANNVGMENVADLAERFGVYDRLNPYTANSLGAQETTIWRMVTAYAMFVNGGQRIEPTLLDRVQDRTGDTIYIHDRRNCGAACMVTDWRAAQPPELADPRPRVISDASAYQMVSVLQGVVQRGTGRALQSLGREVAGKTGTTNDFRDGWFVGFSPDLVVGVYVGFDTPRSMGSGESGGGVAAPVFEKFMENALPHEPNIPFRIPPSIALVRIDANSGLAAPIRRDGGPALDPYSVNGCQVTPIIEAFKLGTAPTTYACSGGVVDSDANFYTNTETVRDTEDWRNRLNRLRGLEAPPEEDEEDEDLSGIY